jgi:hypothetical protein
VGGKGYEAWKERREAEGKAGDWEKLETMQKLRENKKCGRLLREMFAALSQREDTPTVTTTSASLFKILRHT